MSNKQVQEQTEKEESISADERRGADDQHKLAAWIASVANWKIWWPLRALWHLSSRLPKGRWHWVRVVVAIILGLSAREIFSKQDFWNPARFAVYDFVHNLLPRDPHPQRTVLVLIGDEEYWKGELQGREPIKRDYLARLITALDEAEAAVIALDFDLRITAPEGTADGYEDETRKLVAAVQGVSKTCKVVLPTTYGYDGHTNPDIYDEFFGNTLVRKGYITFPKDEFMDRIPVISLPDKKANPIDSFAQAIVRADNEAVYYKYKQPPDDYELPYVGFMKTEAFTKIAAGDVLRGDEAAMRDVAHQVVIVGGKWHRFGYNQGNEQIDAYDSPLGRKVPGVIIHANYVEAMLDSRIYRPWQGWICGSLEFLAGLAINTPFALDWRFRRKLLVVFGLCVLLFGLSTLSLMIVGRFFDFFMPVVLVVLHGVGEQIWEWRTQARQHHAPGPQSV